MSTEQCPACHGAGFITLPGLDFTGGQETFPCHCSDDHDPLADAGLPILITAYFGIILLFGIAIFYHFSKATT